MSKQTNSGSYEVRLMSMNINRLKNVHKLENVGHSDLVLCGFLDLVHMPVCIKYEGSKTYQVGMRGGYRKNGRSFSNVGHID